MKRVLALAMAAMLFAATPALAQSAPAAARGRQAPATASRVDFSPRAAGIDAIAASRARRTDARGERAAQGTSGRSFWKTPWPYAIIGGVVAAGLIIASSSGDGGIY